MSAIDTHVHLLNKSKFHISWLSDPGYDVIDRSWLPEDLEPLLKEAGVSGVVVIEATASAPEGDWLIELGNSYDFIRGFVAWADVEGPDLDRQLSRLTKSPKMKGIRFSPKNKEQRWMPRPELVRGLKLLAEYDLTFDMGSRPAHLTQIPLLAEKVPELRIALNHIANPDIKSHQMEPWATDIEGLSPFENVSCKVSGMVTQADMKNWTTTDLRPYGERVRKVFGVDRLLLGSDWPPCLLGGDYKRVVRAYIDSVGTLSSAEQTKFLHANAEKFYRL